MLVVAVECDAVTISIGFGIRVAVARSVTVCDHVGRVMVVVAMMVRMDKKVQRMSKNGRRCERGKRGEAKDFPDHQYILTGMSQICQCAKTVKTSYVPKVTMVHLLLVGGVDQSRLCT